jgi:hypothetical protein
MEIILQCEECSGDLDFSVSLGSYGNGINIDVTPCTKCLEKAKNEGIEEGMNVLIEVEGITQDDLNDAVKEAFDDGYKKGLGDREEIL